MVLHVSNMIAKYRFWASKVKYTLEAMSKKTFTMTSNVITSQSARCIILKIGKKNFK